MTDDRGSDSEPIVEQPASAASAPAASEPAADPVAASPTPAYAAPPPIAPPSPQPAVAWAAPPVVAAVGRRTGLAAAAGIILIVLGVIGLVIGGLFFAASTMVGNLTDSGAFDSIPGMPAGFQNAFSGIIAIVAIILIAYSAMYILSGIGVLASRGWGRVVGIIVGILSSLFWLLGLLGSISGPATSQVNTSGSVGFAAVLLAIHVFIFLVLIARWRTRSVATR